jgi:hypothetical protein
LQNQAGSKKEKGMRANRLLALAFVAVTALVPSAVAADAPPIDRNHFQADMRKLWEDHITWTRLYIVDAVGGLPEKDATTQRLLRNQVDIGDAIKPFYGSAAGDQLTGLLRQHILVAAELIDAAKAGNTAKKDDANKRWFANADEIAAFLSKANPKSWPAAATKKMMHDHLDLTTQEVVAHLTKDWPADIAAYDKVHVQILHMADTLSSGIEAQFPKKFKH